MTQQHNTTQAAANEVENQQAARIDIERIAARIRSAPAPAPRMTKRGAVEALKPSLLQALEAGHTAASLAVLLKQNGLTIAPRTLTSWLNIPTPSGSTKKPPMRAKSKSSRTR